MAVLTLHPDNDNLIRWDEMKTASDGEFCNIADVTFALKTSSGSTVTGGTGTMSYVAASDGRYQGTILGTVSLTVGGEYYLELTATAGGANGFRRIPCVVAYRENL